MTLIERFIEQSQLALWPQRIAAADDAQRLFHGRGQCFDGLEFITVDYFQPLLWVVLYSRPDADFLAGLEFELKSRFADLCDAAIIQNRYENPIVSHCLWGEIPDKPFYANETDLQFQLTLNGRQNIGYFMDMQPARQWLAERAEGRRVLNLFAYTCAFSIAAAKAGAAEVVNVDMSKAAIRQGQANHAANGLSGYSGLRFLSWDIFKSWGKLRQMGPFDVLICDPPSRQAGSFDAGRDYQKLVKRFAALAAPGADLLLCLNAPYISEEFLHGLMAEYCIPARFVQRLTGRADFPEKEADAALKVLHYRFPE